MSGEFYYSKACMSHCTSRACKTKCCFSVDVFLSVRQRRGGRPHRPSQSCGTNGVPQARALPVAPHTDALDAIDGTLCLNKRTLEARVHRRSTPAYSHGGWGHVLPHYRTKPFHTLLINPTIVARQSPPHNSDGYQQQRAKRWV